MAGVLGCLHNEAEGGNEEVDQLGGVRVMDVLPQLGLGGN